MTTDQLAHAPTLRRRVYEILNVNDPTDRIGRAVTIGLIVLITLNILAVILETVESYNEAYGRVFKAFDLFSVAVFSIEYLLRVWSCVEDPKYANRKMPRLRYMVSPMAIIDLLAILPFYLSLFFTMDLRFLRSLRLLRVFKLTRYSQSMSMLLEVLQEESGTLFAGFFLLLVLLIMASSGAYLVEHEAQPDAFGSIPQSMWWALVTLTTVGYGDVTPITPAGRIFGGIVTVLGVGMAALPAGVLASGVAEHAHQRRDGLRQKYREALEDGVVDTNEETELEALRVKLGLNSRVALQIRRDVEQQQKLQTVFDTICPNCGYNLTTHENKPES